ncbi:MAG: hypothetical protein KF696_11395 [Planctomycetes bacterium]|nr:hypothetical protein [Planctomycetota bacterium]MCW8135744.1 hypothetical protein [Planctomycetota bacterium]
MRDLERMRESGGDNARALAAQVEELKKELQDTQSKLATRHEHVAKLAPELDAAKKENEKLKARVTELEKSASTEKMRTDMDLANAEAARTKAQNALEQAHADLHSAQEERKALAREAKELRAKLDELREAQTSEAEGVNARVKELEAELEAGEQRVHELEKELAAKSASGALLADKEKRLSELEQELVDARAEAVAAEKVRASLDEELKALREKLARAEKEAGGAREQESRLQARDHQLEVAQRQISDLKEELKLEEEERARAAQHLQQAREAEQRALEQAESLEAELEEARKRAKEAEKAAAARSAELEGGAKQENEQLRARNDEITRKRDEVLQGLERAVGEIDELKKALAERDVDARTVKGELEHARKELEGMQALERELAELNRKHNEALTELARVGSSMTNAETAAEKTREEVQALRDKIEQANERRHEAEKQLIEARARLDSEQHIRGEQAQRIKQLEESLARERETVDQSAPAAALESLSSQLAAEREKWERAGHEKDRELEDLRKKVAEAELRESDLASQLEGIELSQQDVMRAKALAGQRRAQIERMQADVEGARRKAEESEAYWKSEMDEFRQAVADHIAAAEAGEEGSDQKLQKLLENLKIGIADKYAKLRRKHTRTEKELQEAQDKLAALEHILARREEEEARMRKVIDELETRENVPGARKKKAAESEAKPEKKPAKPKKATRKK